MAEIWFRWHHGTVTDPKWRIVAARAGHAMSRNVTIGSVIAVWSAMMENASQANPRGVLSNWSDEDVGAAIDIPEQEVSSIRAAMQGKTLDGDRLTGWNRRQINKEDPTATDRQKRKRDRDRANNSHDDDRDNDDCHATSRDVTTDKKRVEKKRKEQKTRSSADDLAASFEDFWLAYPKKVAKQAAVKAWAKLKPDTDLVAVIIADVIEQGQSVDWRRENRRFAPHPASYLNGKRWLDGDTSGDGGGDGGDGPDTDPLAPWLEGAI